MNPPDGTVRVNIRRLEALEEVAETTRRFHSEDLEREPVEGCTCTLCSIRFAFKKLDTAMEDK